MDRKTTKVRDFANHILKENKGSDRPSRIAILDTETYHKDDGKTQHHYMDFAWVNYFERDIDGTVSRDSWELYSDSRKMWEYIFSKAYDKSTLYLFGHNVYFDLQCSSFFVYASEYGWKLKFLYDKGLNFILSIFKDKKKIKIISTTNYYDFSLKKVGEALGIKKMDVDFDSDSVEYKQSYCKNDVLITRVALLRYLDFITEHDMGNFAMTKASQALNAFRHRFMGSRICVHSESDIVAMERESYMGGRNEAFELGDLKDGPFYHYDINSMYPYVMRNNRYPVRLVDLVENINQNDLHDYLSSFCALAEVDIETDKPAYPIRNNGKIIFPVGRIKTVLPTGSILYAIEHGHIRRIGKVALYESEYIFRDYIDYFYSLKRRYKEECNEVYTRIVKIFLNSLYGKLGQKNSVEDISYSGNSDSYYRMECFDIVTHEKWTETELLNTKILEKGEEEAKTSLVAIPSHVTDYARLVLWSIIDMVGYDNCLYCDTDSLKIRERDKDRITYKIDNYELGALSLEDITEQFVIYGCKDYRTEKSEKIKGVPKNYERINENTFKFSVFPRMNTHLRKQVADHYLINEMIKTNKRIYDKGMVDPCNRVHPFHMTQW